MQFGGRYGFGSDSVYSETALMHVAVDDVNFCDGLECVSCKGRFTNTPNLNRNQTETVTATELHCFVFGRPFTYEPNPWTKYKKMPLQFGLISLSDSRNTFTIHIVPCHCLKFVVFVVALGLAPKKSVVSCL